MKAFHAHAAGRGNRLPLLAAGRDAGTVHVIGDADAVGNLMSAVWAAYELSYKL